MSLTPREKEANMDFFKWTLDTLEGKVYHWPDMGYNYSCKNGFFVAPQKELEAIAEITPKCFQKRLKVGPPVEMQPSGNCLVMTDDQVLEQFGLEEDKPSTRSNNQ